MATLWPALVLQVPEGLEPYAPRETIRGELSSVGSNVVNNLLTLEIVCEELMKLD